MENKTLNKAKSKKKDDFYTTISVIEDELKHYIPHFKNKVVLCNCDDPSVSKFFYYFSYNFEKLKLKKLIATCYKNQTIEMFSDYKAERSIYIEYTGDKNGNRVPDPEEIGVVPLKGDGDFRSPECIDLLKQADIVVTNPPFSLFREYIKQLMEYKKKFLIIGNHNSISYQDVFPLIKNNEIWFGCSRDGSNVWFEIPDSYKTYHKIENGKKYAFVAGVVWFTNLPHKKRNQEIILVKTYEGNEKDYPKYDDYDAIEVGRVAKIPKDYYGVMGVPITFLYKYNPNQFEIIGIMATSKITEFNFGYPNINGKGKYARILIKHRRK